MTKKAVGFFIGALFMALTASLAFAQQPQGKDMGGWGMGTKYQRMYNPATVETIIGTVESVDKMTPMRGMSSGVHLMVKTDKETLPVHLGPSWHLDKQEMKLAKGDTVTVTGSRVTMDGKPVIVASEVKKGDAAMKLRDDKGVPSWAGAGMKR